ncbi:hypothetical protein [Stagnimonas aquatica]|nr:hypothetical protein [Stagnimonas aquatica]
MNRNLNALVFGLAVFAAPMALAAGSAQIESGLGSDRARAGLEFDGARLRMQASTGAAAGQGYLIFRDGKAYTVGDMDGQPFVMEMGAMMKMAGQMAAQGAPRDGLDDVAAYHGLSATGRSETVAGLRGEVYRLDYTTRSGDRQSKEMVLTANTTAREMTEALSAFGTAMQAAAGIVEPEGSLQLQAEFQRRGLGLLRVGDEFRVLSLSTSKPAAARFELPAEPMQMPAGLSGLGALGGAGGAASGNPLGGVFGQKVERQQDRVQGRAEAEVDSATDRAVDKVLDKAFGKLFGGD